MKIVTWNCNGAFRNKFQHISHLEADILIIQECENPESISKNNENYHQFAKNALWCGSSNKKGLGVFANKEIVLNKLEWNHLWRGRSLQWFLPFRINDKQTILAVWNHHAKAKAFKYIGQFWLFIQNNRQEFKNLIIAGDFNSNSIWDAWDRWWNHSDCIKELKENNIESVYHTVFNIEQGAEKHNTFFLHRDQNKGSHIDYIFGDRGFINKTKTFNIFDYNDWKEYSDHVPVVWEFEE